MLCSEVYDKIYIILLVKYNSTYYNTNIYFFKLNILEKDKEAEYYKTFFVLNYAYIGKLIEHLKSIFLNLASSNLS